MLVYTSFYVFVVCVFVCVLYFFFFFQAEDGIRDLVRSRGLGDVYKRQSIGRIWWSASGLSVAWWRFWRDENPGCASPPADPVSYTHLTLPTSDLV